MQLQRQPGPKNFLTWAFFLAGASAADLLLTGPTKAQEDEFSENSLKHSEAPANELPTDVLQRKIDVAEAQIVAPSSSSAIGSDVTPHLGTLAQIDPLLPLSAIEGQTPPVGSGAPAASLAGSSSQGRIGSSSTPDNSLPTPLPDIGVTELTPPPPITVDIGLTPVLGFDVSIDAGGLIVAVGLDLNLDNLLVNPLQDVTGLVDSLVTDLATLLNNDLLGLGDLLESNPLNLAALTGLTLTDGIAGLLGARDNEPSGALATDSGAASGPLAAALITDAGDFLAPGLLSGGMLNFPAVSVLAQPDDLFAQGQHTDYNIALRVNARLDADEPPPPQPDTAGVAPTDPTPQDDQPPTDSAISGLLPLDDLVTRLSV